MKNRFLAVGATLSLCAGPLLGAGADRTEPGPDAHFMDKGTLVRGVRCATPASSPAMRAQVEKALAAAREFIATREAAKTIPVVFHVIHNGTEGNVPESMIDAQVAVLNSAYSGTGFSFVKQATNRVENKRWFTGCYSNQRFKKSLAVDPAHTLNFYTCKPRGGILGYAYLPQSFEESNYHHGVVVLYSSLPGGGAVPYDEGDTGTHEAGHYLGLEHTFQNGCSAPGDSVDDTPYEASAAFGCPTGRDTCSSPGADPIENFMDYTDDACMTDFTPNQATRMQEMVATYKPSL